MDKTTTLKTSGRTIRLLGAAVAAALSMAGNGAMGQPNGGQNPAIVALPPAGARGGPMVAVPPSPNGMPAGDDTENPMQVYIEDSFAAQDKLTRAMNFERKEQIPEAIEAYQGVIDDYGDKLTKLDSNTYVSIMDVVRHRLEVMPAVKAGAYDDKYSVAAGAAIKAAEATKDLSALIKACDRYYIATAAVKGLQTAAEWEFERGEFTMAARLWGQLADHPRAGTAVPVYLHHAALAAHMEGSDDLARKLHDRLEASSANATGLVNGKTVNLVDNLDELFKTPAWETAKMAPGEWPTFMGNAARSGVPDVSSTAGAKLWSYVLDESKLTGAVAANPVGINGIQNGVIIRNGVRMRIINGVPQDSGLQLSSFGVMSQGVLYVHAGDRIIAMTSGSGVVRWTYPTQADAAAPATGTLTRQQILLRNQQMYGINSASSGSQDSCTVYGDEVFALLPTMPTVNQANRVVYNNGNIMASKLVALDKNGQEMFKPVLSSDLDIAKQGGVSFVGSPVATAHGVFVLARRMGTDTFTNLYLVKVNRTTGAVDWSRYLCGAAAGTMYGNIQAQFQAAAAPAFADDTVYVTTGQGVDAAVDGPTGRVRWLTLTALARQPRGSSVYQQQMQQVGTPAWKFNAPIVTGEKLVSLEPGSAFRVYDRWTGKALVEVPTKDPALDNPEILAGIEGDNAVLVGASIRIVSLTTGKLAVDPDSTPLPNPSETGPMMGRPFLTKKFLYMPMEKALVMVDLEGGKDTQFTGWPKDEKGEQAKPGNVLVTSEEVIVINDGEVASYAKWETARDSRLADIKAHPEAPEGYLSLAEVAFRTQHFDIAQENMTRAVDLAVAKGMSSDIVGEIYRTNMTLARQLAARSDDSQKLARFYYEQAKKSAGTPEANAEWRMALSGLALSEKNLAEAAGLYNEVLNDPAMRAATLHSGDNTVRAGTLAEVAFKSLMERDGDIYKPYEQQAAALLAKVGGGQDAAALQNVIDAYPNSRAALAAGGELAAAQGQKGSFEDQVRTLGWVKSRTGAPLERARIEADMAQADLELKRWASATSAIERGRRLAPNLQWTVAGRAMTFDALNAKLQTMDPDSANVRRPMLNMPMDDTVVKLTGGKAIGLADAGPADAKLLVPMEMNLAARRPDVIPVLEGNKTVRLYEARGLKERWNADLSEHMDTILVGYSGNAMVLAQRNKLIGLDMKTGVLKFEISLNMDGNQINQHQNEVAQLQNAVIQMLQQNPQTQINWQMNQQNGDGEFLLNAPNQGSQMSIDADQVHVMAYRQGLGGAPAFNVVRIFGSRIAVITGNKLDAYDSNTGKRLWDTVQLPAGCAQSMAGNDELLVAEVEKIDVNNPNLPGTGSATFEVIDAETGKRTATLGLDEHVMWRNLGDDGVLTCVTEEGASAFNLKGDTTRPLWHRDDVHAMTPTAIAMGMDGVSVVSRNRTSGAAELVTIAADGTEPFAPKGIELGGANINGIQYLKLIADGETVIVQTTQTISAYKTSDGTVAWSGVFSEPPPPLVESQMTQKHIAVLGYGQVTNTERSDKLALFNRVDPKTGQLTNGKLELEKPLRRSSNKDDLAGPVIQRWAVVDGAICLDINGSVIVYRSKAQEAAN